MAVVGDLEGVDSSQCQVLEWEGPEWAPGRFVARTSQRVKLVLGTWERGKPAEIHEQAEEVLRAVALHYSEEVHPK